MSELLEQKARPTYTYRAPSGVWVTSIHPYVPDPWLRFGAIGYGFCSYRHLFRTLRKTRRKERGR